MSSAHDSPPEYPATPARGTRPGGTRPLDQVVESMRPSLTRAVPEPSSLSERAARVLASGPADALSLMREVCRVDRLKAVAAERMAEVLLGARPEFVQLDDDRWALLRDGQVAQGPPEIATSAAPAAHRPRVRPDHSPDFASMRFAVVDVETTGSHTGGTDRITEIAIVPVAGLQVGTPWEQLVQPGMLIPPFIQSLTGISNAMVAHAPMFHEIADEVIARLDGQMFTAHNAAFDRRFVASELLRTRHIFLDGQSLCTVRLARRLLPTLPRRSLDRVCEHFGIANAGRHRAGGDALATAHCLVRMLHIAQDDGLTTWAQLQRFLSGPTRRTTRRSALPSPVREDTSA